MTIILPEGVAARWVQALAVDNYHDWRACSDMLQRMAEKIICNPGKREIADDMLTLSGVAKQRALDMQPAQSMEDCLEEA